MTNAVGSGVACPGGPAWWKVGLATTVIFAAGVVTGGLLVAQLDRDREQAGRSSSARTGGRQVGPASYLPPPPEWPRRSSPELQRRMEERRAEYLGRVTRELDLRPEQRARIEQILRESQDEIRRVWESVQPELRRHLWEAQERIRRELTPEQRREFERLLRRESGRRAEGPPGSPEPPAHPGPPSRGGR